MDPNPDIGIEPHYIQASVRRWRNHKTGTVVKSTTIEAKKKMS
jgi:hypothetical protein